MNKREESFTWETKLWCCSFCRSSFVDKANTMSSCESVVNVKRCYQKCIQLPWEFTTCENYPANCFLLYGRKFSSVPKKDEIKIVSPISYLFTVLYYINNIYMYVYTYIKLNFFVCFFFYFILFFTSYCFSCCTSRINRLNQRSIT